MTSRIRHPAASFLSIGKSQRGFSLIELLAALAIVSIMMMISVVTYNTFRTRNTLQSSLENIANAITLTRLKAVTQGHEWFIEFIFNAVEHPIYGYIGDGSYLIVDDDGWQSSFETDHPRDMYRLDYTEIFWGPNGKLDKDELYRHEKLIGGTMYLEKPYFKTSGPWGEQIVEWPCCNKITFEETGAARFEPMSSEGIVWICDIHFIGPVKPDDSFGGINNDDYFDEDNLLHRGRIMVQPNGQIDVIRK